MRAHALIGFHMGRYDQWNIIVYSLLTRVIMYVYKNGWDVPIREVINSDRESGNRSDPCAVAVKRDTLGASLI